MTHVQRVLLLNASGYFAGAEAMLLDLATRLDRERWRPLVLVPEAGPLYDALQRAGVDARLWPLATLRTRRDLLSPRALGRSAWRLPRSAAALADLIRREGVAVVHSNSSVLLDGALAARWARVPHVWHVRELLGQPRAAWAVLRRLIPACSARVLCISRAVVRHFGSLSGSDRARLAVVPDGVAAQEFSGVPARAWPWPAGTPVVGMVARVNGQKGHEDFLHAAARLRDAHPAARFVVAGGALPAYAHVERELRRLSEQLGLGEHVLFLGTLGRADVRAVLLGLDVFVMPSRVVEGFGLSALEAMAAGLPVVATGGGPDDLVVEGQTGYLVARADPAGLASALSRLLGDPALARRFGAAGQARALAEFSIERHVARVQTVYEEVGV